MSNRYSLRCNPHSSIKMLEICQPCHKAQRKFLIFRFFLIRIKKDDSLLSIVAQFLTRSCALCLSLHIIFGTKVYLYFKSNSTYPLRLSGLDSFDKTQCKFPTQWPHIKSNNDFSYGRQFFMKSIEHEWEKTRKLFNINF